MKKCSGHSMQQEFGQQRTALPNKLQRYARMHTWSPWPLLIEHMAQTNASRLTIFICSVQRPSEMIILTLPRRESFWFSLCQPENLLEAKPVDVRLRRNKGRNGKGFSDLVRRKQRLVTAKLFSLPILYAATVLFVVLGRALRLHVTSKPHKKQRGKCCHELDEGRCLGWCEARGQRRNDDAQRPSQPADLKEHVHHTSWTFLLSARIKDPIWSHSNETDLHLRF